MLLAALAAGIALVPAAHAATDTEKRELLGYVNEFRAEEGARPLQFAGPLARSAQKYADWLVENNQFDHEADGSTAGRRAMAEGWWEANVTENLGSGESARDVSYAWYYSRGDGQRWGHYEGMVDPHRAAAGIGERDGTWVIVFGRECPENSRTRCEMSGDFGPAPVAGPGSSPTAQQPPPGSTKRPPGLLLGTPRALRHRTISLSAVVRAEASGSLRLRITGSGGYEKWVRPHARSGRRYVFRTRVGRRGRLTLQVRFTGHGPWADATARRTIRIR